MNLFRKLFPKASELADANNRIDALEADKVELNRRLSNLWESYHAHDATVQKQRTELAEMKKKLREQTDADLLLVSARIAIATIKGEKPAEADVLLQGQLHAQQQSMRPYSEWSSTSYASLAQNLGMGGIFFGR
jgi:predicted  nucleic acid-binding Zn-ribbon protein